MALCGHIEKSSELRLHFGAFKVQPESDQVELIIIIKRQDIADVLWVKYNLKYLGPFVA